MAGRRSATLQSFMVAVTGTACGSSALDFTGALIGTNGARNNLPLMPPTAEPNGDLVGIFQASAISSFSWSLKPVAE